MTSSKTTRGTELLGKVLWVLFFFFFPDALTVENVRVEISTCSALYFGPSPFAKEQLLTFRAIFLASFSLQLIFSLTDKKRTQNRSLRLCLRITTEQVIRIHQIRCISKGNTCFYKNIETTLTKQHIEMNLIFVVIKFGMESELSKH